MQALTMYKELMVAYLSIEILRKLISLVTHQLIGQPLTANSTPILTQTTLLIVGQYLA